MRYRAFLVAINDYGHPRNNLPSCIADLKYVDQLLRSTLKVPGDKIRALVDRQATVEAVVEGLEWLTNDISDDERLLFFFSGHGYQLRGANGSVDEALVLVENKFLLDDALVKGSQAAKPGTLTVLLDSCFGGGNDKIFIPAGDFGTLAKPKCWSPPDSYLEKDIDKLVGGEAVQITSYNPFGSRSVSSKVAPSVVFSESGLTPWPTAMDEAGQASINGVLLAACLEDETASASTDQTQGLSAFTYALKRVVEQQGVDLTLQQMRDGTDRVLKTLGFRQTSTLKIGTGPVDRDSRFLSLTRKPSAASWFVDRRIDMTDTKFLEPFIPILIERVVNELTKKGYTPSGSGGDKFFPGFETLVPILVNRAIDELTKKGYSPPNANGAASKFPGAEIIVREIIDRVVREVTGKDFVPPNSGAEKFPGLETLIPIIVHELIRKGYAPASGTADKFFPGAEIIIPVIVDRVVQQFAR